MERTTFSVSRAEIKIVLRPFVLAMSPSANKKGAPNAPPCVCCHGTRTASREIVSHAPQATVKVGHLPSSDEASFSRNVCGEHASPCTKTMYLIPNHLRRRASPHEDIARVLAPVVREVVVQHARLCVCSGDLHDLRVRDEQLAASDGELDLLVAVAVASTRVRPSPRSRP